MTWPSQMQNNFRKAFSVSYSTRNVIKINSCNLHICYINLSVKKSRKTFYSMKGVIQPDFCLFWSLITYIIVELLNYSRFHLTNYCINELIQKWVDFSSGNKQTKIVIDCTVQLCKDIPHPLSAKKCYSKLKLLSICRSIWLSI